MSVDVVALRPGDVFHGRYAVVRRLAAGGMGAVYEVTHLGTQRRCAMKLMLPALVAKPELRARFQTEATIAARIGSEHIVDVFDAGVDAATSVPFLVMELLEGTELGALLRKNGPLGAAETLTLLQHAALALGKTHAAGIVHRDLKPENMFVTRRDDGTPRLKILDFGIARMVAESGRATNHTGMLGTPAYMAPEQVDASVPLTPAADTFALAHVAYTMLVGEIYWEEEAIVGPFMLALKVVTGLPESPVVRARRRKGVVLPAAFDGWFARATAPSPAERFQSAAHEITALAVALGMAQVGPTFQAAAPPPSATLASPVRAPDASESVPLSSTLPRPGAAPLATAPMVTAETGGPTGLHAATEPAAPVARALRPLGEATQISGVNMRPAGGITTIPVSSDAITKRIEPAPRPFPRIQVAILSGVLVVLAMGAWLVVRGAASTPGAATAQASSPAVSLSSSPPVTPTSPATTSSAATTAELPPGPSASVSVPPPRSSGKTKPKPTATARNPLDEGP